MSALKDYLRTKRERMDSLPGDREQIKRRWLDVLGRLMRQIDEWVEPLEQVGLRVDKSDVPIHEESLGPYEAPTRRLVFAGTAVRIKPVAHIIIGGDGRVDILGPNERLMLVYSEADDAWSIVGLADLSNRRPFTRDSFEGILKAYL